MLYILCSDASEHRLRVESRTMDESGLKPPKWSEVESREFHDWTVDRIIVDTAGRSQAVCAEDLLLRLSCPRR